METPLAESPKNLVIHTKYQGTAVEVTGAFPNSQDVSKVLYSALSVCGAPYVPYFVLYVILFLNIRQVVIQYLLAGPVMNSSDTAGIIRRKEKQFPVRILCQSESERQRDRESPLPPRRWKKKGERALDTLCH